MNLSDRITINPKVCFGKPCIKGRRLAVEFILELLIGGMKYEEIQEEYNIEYEDILAVLNYAKLNVQKSTSIDRILTEKPKVTINYEDWKRLDKEINDDLER